MAIRSDKTLAEAIDTTRIDPAAGLMGGRTTLVITRPLRSALGMAVQS
jgi:hypothetical protein